MASDTKLPITSQDKTQRNFLPSASFFCFPGSSEFHNFFYHNVALKPCVILIFAWPQKYAKKKWKSRTLTAAYEWSVKQTISKIFSVTLYTVLYLFGDKQISNCMRLRCPMSCLPSQPTSILFAQLFLNWPSPYMKKKTNKVSVHEKVWFPDRNLLWPSLPSRWVLSSLSWPTLAATAS